MSASSAVSSKELEAWIDLYGPRLLPVAGAFASGCDEAEDILQEVWIIAAHKSHLKPAGTPIRAWLYTITLNIGRSLVRKRQRRAKLFGLWQSLAGHEHTEREPASIGAELARLRLWREVAELPELQKQVVLLRVVEGMSTGEAARALDRAEGTVQASLYRATARLRRELGGHPRGARLLADWRSPVNEFPQS